jgi:hypothetical protein
VDGELMDKASLRRPDIDAFELILGGDDPFPQFGDFTFKSLRTSV